MTCQGLFGRLFGHKYTGIYSKSAPSSVEIDAVLTSSLLRVMEAARSVKYECHVCTRCGHVVNKGETK